MFGLIFGIILLVVGLGLAVYCATHKEIKYQTDGYGRKVVVDDGNYAVMTTAPFKKYSLPIAVIAIVLCVVLVFLGCIASVPTGHTGVVTTFGRVESQTYDAGFNLKAPWQSVITMDNRVQKATTTLSCFSADIQEVSVTYALNYQIDKVNAQEIYKTVGKEYYDTVIVPNIAEAVKVVTARYTAEELISSRAELAIAIEETLSASLAQYNIQVVSAAIEDMDFTDAFTNAVEAKQVAAQNKLQAEIEQAQKIMEQEAAAEMAVIKAEAAAQVAKTEADAKAYAGQKEAEANAALEKSITKELLDYYYILQWNGILPSTYVGSDDVSTIVNGAGGN